MTAKYESGAEDHPGIDPATGHERSVLKMLGALVERWRAEDSLDPEVQHNWQHDPDRDGWSMEVSPESITEQ